VDDNEFASQVGKAPTSQADRVRAILADPQTVPRHPRARRRRLAAEQRDKLARSSGFGS
jgi:hypothetical protein